MADIERIDEKTFYVKSSQPDKEPYMVFKSENKGWVCDCPNWYYNLDDHDKSIDCKHIKRIKSEFNIT